MRVGYIPLSLEQQIGFTAFMFPTLEFKEDAFHLADGLFTHLRMREFGIIEKSSLLDDLRAPYVRAMNGIVQLPMFLIFVIDQNIGKEELDRLIASHRLNAQRFATSFILLKKGQMYDPAECVIYSRFRTSNNRYPGQYGREPLNRLGGYSVNLIDLQEAENIYYALRAVELKKSYSPFDFSIELFREAYNYSISVQERALLLLSALELIIDGQWDLLSSRIRSWSKLGYRDLNMREVRNKLAHDYRIEPGDFDALEESCRFVLKRSLTLAAYDNVSPAGDYNKVLEKHFDDESVQSVNMSQNKSHERFSPELVPLSEFDWEKAGEISKRLHDEQQSFLRSLFDGSKTVDGD